MRLDQPYGKRFDEKLANTEPIHKYFIACEGKKTGERTKTEILLKDDFLHGSYNKARIKFERDFKPYVRVAIENSKKYAISVHDLKTKIGTNISARHQYSA